VFHIIWGCKSTMAVWQECGKKIQKLSLGEGDGKSLLQFLLGKLEGEDVQMVCVVSQLIWLRRNDLVFGCELKAPGSTLAEAQHMVQDFNQAMLREDRCSGEGLSLRTTWLPPPKGALKVNWASYTDAETHRTGIGVLVRVANGELVAAQAKFFPSRMESNVATVLGAWYAVKLGVDMGASHVHFEGDSFNVVTALKRSDPCCSRFGHVIEDTQLLSRLRHCSFHHANREANLYAYHLARIATSQCLDNVWKGFCPSFILSVLRM